MVGINLENWCLCLPIRFLFLSGKLDVFRSCVQSHMLHGSETWPVRKENKLAEDRDRNDQVNVTTTCLLYTSDAADE